jgi:hypothetical protein
VQYAPVEPPAPNTPAGQKRLGDLQEIARKPESNPHAAASEGVSQDRSGLVDAKARIASAGKIIKKGYSDMLQPEVQLGKTVSELPSADALDRDQQIISTLGGLSKSARALSSKAPAAAQHRPIGAGLLDHPIEYFAGLPGRAVRAVREMAPNSDLGGLRAEPPNQTALLAFQRAAEADRAARGLQSIRPDLRSDTLYGIDRGALGQGIGGAAQAAQPILPAVVAQYLAKLAAEREQK